MISGMFSAVKKQQGKAMAVGGSGGSFSGFLANCGDVIPIYGHIEKGNHCG